MMEKLLFYKTARGDLATLDADERAFLLLTGRQPEVWIEQKYSKDNLFTLYLGDALFEFLQAKKERKEGLTSQFAHFLQRKFRKFLFPTTALPAGEVFFDKIFAAHKDPVRYLVFTSTLKPKYVLLARALSVFFSLGGKTREEVCLVTAEQLKPFFEVFCLAPNLKTAFRTRIMGRPIYVEVSTEMLNKVYAFMEMEEDATYAVYLRYSFAGSIPSILIWVTSSILDFTQKLFPNSFLREEVQK